MKLNEIGLLSGGFHITNKSTWQQTSPLTQMLQFWMGEKKHDIQMKYNMLTCNMCGLISIYIVWHAFIIYMHKPDYTYMILHDCLWVGHSQNAHQSTLP